MHDEELQWFETERSVVADGRVVRFMRSHRTHPKLGEGDFYLLDAPNWVNVIAEVETPGGEPDIVLVRQYRHGNDRVVLEFPGGIIEEGESVLDAAARELKEETGFSVLDIEIIGECSPNPAIMTNRVYTAFARAKDGPERQNLDEHELVDVSLVPRDKLLEGSVPGLNEHAITNSSMYFYLTTMSRRKLKEN